MQEEGAAATPVGCTPTTTPSKSRGSGGGGGRGKGRGGGRGRGGRGGGGAGRGGSDTLNPNNTRRNHPRSSPKKSSKNSKHGNVVHIKNEDVLIQFGQLLRTDSLLAVAAGEVHQKYRDGVIASEQEFINEARRLLMTNLENTDQTNEICQNNRLKKMSNNESARENVDDDEEGKGEKLEESAQISEGSNVVAERNESNVENVTRAIDALLLDSEDRTRAGEISMMEDEPKSLEITNADSDIPVKDTNKESPLDNEKALIKAQTLKRFPKRLNHPKLNYIQVTSSGSVAKVGNDGNSLVLPPKHHFTAHWSLDTTLLENEDMNGLQLGMFRVGANENTQQHAIVVKDATASENNNGIIAGRIPFHAPRAPCEVILRLFRTDDSRKVSQNKSPSENEEEETLPNHVTTLGRSSVVYVKCDSSESAAEVLRGVLGGIKRGLASPLTNVQNLLAILQSFPCHENKNLVYGCVKECIKSIRTATNEFDELCDQIRLLEELQEQSSGKDSPVNSSDNENPVNESSDTKTGGKSRLQKLYTERAASERRIIEMHKTLHSTLQYVLDNRVLSDDTLLSDHIKSFCPVRELFVDWMIYLPSHYFVGHSSYSKESANHINFERFNRPSKPSTLPLSSVPVIYDCPDIVGVKEIWTEQRQNIYAKVVEIVHKILGDQVGVRPFGSSINGFGSQGSDLDLSLTITPDLPQLEALAEAFKADNSGVFAEINTDRLGARIPVIMLKVVTDEGFIDVDISPENALAVINTKLLKCYSFSPLTVPMVRALKKIVKSFDINNPAKGSLSSYGYVLMVLDYLQKAHVLPDLLKLAYGTNDSIISASKEIHRTSLPHPRKKDFVCNVHFLFPTSQNQLKALQQLLVQFASQNHGGNLLFHLANFFYYFAFVFDYRRDVVGSQLDKPMKAEIDPEYFHLKSCELSIQDPFETFYDVGHVLKHSQWFRIRAVFARCYSKITEIISFGDRKPISMQRIIDEILFMAEEDQVYLQSTNV